MIETTQHTVGDDDDDDDDDDGVCARHVVRWIGDVIKPANMMS